MNNTELKKGGLLVLVGLLLFAGTALASGFVMPSANFPGQNAVTPINISSVAQLKLGTIEANRISSYNLKGTSQVCIGDACRSTWPSGSGTSLSTTCRINTKIIPQDPHGADASNGVVSGARVGEKCNGYLSAADKSAGWITTAYDKCPGVQGRDCAGAKYCQYAQIVCDGGISFGQGTQTRRLGNQDGSTAPAPTAPAPDPTPDDPAPGPGGPRNPGEGNEF